MIKLKEINSDSWLVTGLTEPALIMQDKDRYTLMLKGEKKTFRSQTAISEYLESNVFQNVEPLSESKVEYFVRGFPVEFETPYQVYIPGVYLPLYSKKEGSEVYYSAGHYCLEFPKNWMPAYCPKYSTLIQYKYVGPFKTEQEMKTVLTKLRREKKHGINNQNSQDDTV